MFTLGNSTLSNLRTRCLISVAATAVAVIASADPVHALDAWLDAGTGMKIRTERPPSFAQSFDPRSGRTVKVIDNRDGTRTVTSPVSYGSTADASLMRIDDLPLFKAKVQNCCRPFADDCPASRR